MSKQQRMSPKDRKESILKSAIPLFAKQGYNGTTTKMISEAAGISEALLFKYFKNKKELFIELKKQVYPKVDIALNTLPKLTPSTSGLIILVYLIIFETLGPSYNKEEFDIFNRLLTFSLLEDGELAKVFYESKFEKWLPYMAKHFKAAEQSGDLNEGILARKINYGLSII
jgi:AcrR family transcriptional regulator